jgi:SAM-dependent methyltransferase
MDDSSKIRVYDSQTKAYHDAFQVFLDHTDQKVNARAWLDRLVESIPSRRLFIDAGAGTGQTTAWLGTQFEQTMAIEPNPSLREDLRRSCPNAEIVPDTILNARLANPRLVDGIGDFVLCSHVLYYIEKSEWQLCLRHMASWLSPGGTLVVVVQNHETDCMQMLHAFLGKSFNLAAVAQQFEVEQGQHYTVERQLVPAHITAPDLAIACVIAEFMLNLHPIPDPPTRRTLEDYVRNHFANPTGGVRFSCHQDFLVVRPRAQLAPRE